MDSKGWGRQHFLNEIEFFIIKRDIQPFDQNHFFFIKMRFSKWLFCAYLSLSNPNSLENHHQRKYLFSFKCKHVLEDHHWRKVVDLSKDILTPHFSTQWDITLHFLLFQREHQHVAQGISPPSRSQNPRSLSHLPKWTACLKAETKYFFQMNKWRIKIPKFTCKYLPRGNFSQHLK